jgi:hypothetical protein
LLLDQLAVYITDRRVLNLVGQYLRRTAERGGAFWEYKKGISLGCPLSPLIGAFFLNRLDSALEKLGLFYVRFMDDILVLAPTRWKLRGAVKAVNQVLECLGLDKHPEKTFIGRVERGFDFLGYHFSTAGLSVAKQTVINLIQKASQLYEQAGGHATGATLAEIYARRWLAWVNGGFASESNKGHGGTAGPARGCLGHRTHAGRSRSCESTRLALACFSASTPPNYETTACQHKAGEA